MASYPRFVPLFPIFPFSLLFLSRFRSTRSHVGGDLPLPSLGALSVAFIMPNNAPNVYAAIAVTLTLAILALVLRLIARRITTAGYGLDDVLAVAAFVCRFDFASWAFVDIVDL